MCNSVMLSVYVQGLLSRPWVNCAYKNNDRGAHTVESYLERCPA